MPLSRRGLFRQITACAASIAFSARYSDSAPKRRRRRFAVLIGVNTPKAQPMPLIAARYDLRLMGYLLTTCGFDGATAGAFGTGAAAATRDSVRGRLRAIAGTAKNGDEVVFYFSGRGGADEAGAPVLVLDEDDSATNDFALAEVAAWTKAVGKSGAVVTTVLDTGFPVAKNSTDCGRVVNPSPRVRRRSQTDLVKAEPWNGGGLLLAASLPNSPGEAYEWRGATEKDGWHGVFTELLASRALVSFRNNDTPVPKRLINDIADYLAARPDYLPAFQPALVFGGTNPTLWDRALFGANSAQVKTVLKRIPSLNRQVETVAAAAGERRTRLSVAVSVARNSEDTQSEWEETLRGALRAMLDTPGMSAIRVLSAYQGWADCVVKIGKPEGGGLGYTITVKGGDAETQGWSEPHLCETRDAVRDILLGEVGVFLAAQVKRLPDS